MKLRELPEWWLLTNEQRKWVEDTYKDSLLFAPFLERPVSEKLKINIARTLCRAFLTVKDQK